ncbi:MAG: hypothetical protein HZC55_26520 [Verrucomicrobia bacterium]|nr:hypothetical protein [Verrucomicrobiota bacterium]
MAKHIILLGAGASAQFGAPVMSNFLDVARDLYAAGKVGPEKGRFENVFSAIASLQAVHSKADFDLINIESIFTAFELAKTLGRFPDRKPEELDKLIEDLKWLIIVTIEQTVRFRANEGRIEAHDGTASFLAKLRELWKGTPVSLAILTFNYDIIWDLALLQAGFRVDYGVGQRVAEDRRIPLLKLHGSLNWGVESQSGAVVPWFLSNYLSHFGVEPFREIKEARIPIGSQIFRLMEFTSEKKQINPVPVIVPPSWNKADSHRAISSVWAKAAEELSDAESIYVVGYSLPTTDSFFRQLFALGSVGKTLLKRFWVFNPDPSREAVFRGMLGQGALSRFRYYPDTADFAFGVISRAISGKE